MKNFEIKNNIKEFIKIIEKKYDNIFISYEYISDIEGYEIWHNREDLEFEDIEFKRFTGKLLYDMFLSKGFYNLFMSYDYEKSMNLYNMKSITSLDSTQVIQNTQKWHNENDRIILTGYYKESVGWIETNIDNTYSYENLFFQSKSISGLNKTKINQENLKEFDDYSKDESENNKLAA